MTLGSTIFGDTVLKARDLFYLLAVILILNLAFGNLFNMSHDSPSDNIAAPPASLEISEDFPIHIDPFYQDNVYGEQPLAVSAPNINARSACV